MISTRIDGRLAPEIALQAFSMGKINMNALTIAVKTMSSLEIAELTGKEHKNVLVDIRATLDQANISWAGFSAQYKDGSGKSNPMFNLPRRECDLIVSGYSVPYRLAIIDRWHELEAQQLPTFAIPTTLSGALMLAAKQAEQIEEQQVLLAIASPKADALDRISKADGETNVTTAAKELGIQPGKLTAFLSAESWIYKRAGSKNWSAYQEKIKQGLLTHKTTVITKPDGSERICDQVLVTAKGLAKLAQLTSK